MAEFVCSNWKQKCVGIYKCPCGKQFPLKRKAPKGRFGEVRVPHQCDECKALVLIEYKGGGRIIVNGVDVSTCKIMPGT